MTGSKKYLSITWPVLYVGLNNDWLTVKEVADIVNDNINKLNCDEKTLVNINVNDDNKTAVLDILIKKAGDREHEGHELWQLANLIAIEQSDMTIHEKIMAIELQWGRFNYPESWIGFIYYMPNKEASSEENLYQKFLIFLNEEEKRLNYYDIPNNGIM